MALPLLLLVLTAITLSETFYPGRINVGRATGLLIGVLFLFIGNMMGKLKSNYFIGCRTPWALADPDVWNKTQRMGGYVFFITGLAAVLLSLFAPEKVFFWVFLALLLGGHRPDRLHELEVVPGQAKGKLTPHKIKNAPEGLRRVRRSLRGRLFSGALRASFRE